MRPIKWVSVNVKNAFVLPCQGQMRPIKFRYVMRDIEGLRIEIVPLELIEEGGIRLRLNEIIVSCDQFTGLKDKNGAEIYEGDIVRLEASYVKQMGAEGEQIEARVIFLNGAFVFQDVTHDAGILDMGTEYRYAVITGHIHEAEAK